MLRNKNRIGDVELCIHVEMCKTENSNNQRNRPESRRQSTNSFMSRTLKSYVIDTVETRKRGRSANVNADRRGPIQTRAVGSPSDF